MGRHIGSQLVRSGTSPAPNYEEGCAAESRADFIHKLSICLKELRESRSATNFATSSVNRSSRPRRTSTRPLVLALKSQTSVGRGIQAYHEICNLHFTIFNS